MYHILTSESDDIFTDPGERKEQRFNLRRTEVDPVLNIPAASATSALRQKATVKITKKRPRPLATRNSQLSQSRLCEHAYPATVARDPSI